MAKSTTTWPRLAPIDTATRVSRWADSSSSSSSRPAGRSGSLDGAAAPSSVGSGPRPRRSRTSSSTLAHRQLLGDDPPGQGLLEEPVGGAEQRPGVTGAELALGHQLLDRRRQLEQPQGVGDGRPALADPVGDLLVGEAEVLDQLLVGRRLLERVEVLAVEVLDQRLLERVGVVDRPDDRRDGLEPGPLRPPATAARRRSARTGRRRGRTSTGCRTPSSRIDAVSDASASSSKWPRGWCGLGSIGRPGGPAASVDSTSATSAVGISAPRPLPSPLRRATAHLLGQLPIGDGAPRARIERDDRLTERRCLGQADRPGDDVATHPVAEVLADLVRPPGRPAWSGRRT